MLSTELTPGTEEANAIVALALSNEPDDREIVVNLLLGLFEVVGMEDGEPLFKLTPKGRQHLAHTKLGRLGRH